METITKYKAFDGLEFTDADACREHETNCLLAAQIMGALPARPDTCEFLNGHGFLWHDKDTFLAVRNKFCEFAKRYTNHKRLQQSIDKGLDAHPSWVGRILDETAPSTISKHWYRFMCVDSELREWGQPYFANNPSEGEQKQLN